MEDKQKYIKELSDMINELNKIQKDIFNIIKEKYNYTSPWIPALVEDAIRYKRYYLETLLEEVKLEIKGE